MSAPILATKLFRPLLRSKIVLRRRLLERLNEGYASGARLTLVSAAAGFGKTTLLGEWLSQPRDKGASPDSSPVTPPSRAAWLSLDEGDSDLGRFLAYFIAALQTIFPTAGERSLALLQASQLVHAEVVLTAVLNEIAALPDPFILVLDDYHLLLAPPIDQAITFLLDHQPPQMHLVIATREDPPLPLARLRARGQLTELRAADLRFTHAEAADFLNRVMGLALLPADVAALENRTEGWIAGLQLAALALQGTTPGHQDVAGFIRAFSGSHHFVLDYLLTEVLQQQPAHMQSFLLRTAILDRLCGPLCDVVLAADEGSSAITLQHLERANLFIVPLDSERQWYRFHHLFVDLLRQRLHQPASSFSDSDEESTARLHSRASAWFQQNGFEAEAFHHALAAGEFERAADLAELWWQAMETTFQSAVWLGWVQKLPPELFSRRPVLIAHMASALMDMGDLEASESRLQEVERQLSGSPMDLVYLDEAQFRALPSKIALARAYSAQSQGNFSVTMEYARQALALVVEDDPYTRAAAVVTLGFSHWVNGDLQAAHNVLVEWMASMKQVGNVVYMVATTFALADIMVAQGRLHETVKTYEQALEWAAAYGQDAQRITAHHYLGLAMVYHEWDEKETAVHYLVQAEQWGERTTLVDWPCRWRLAQARLKESEGDLAAALALLDEAKRLFVRIPVPDVRPIECLKARVWLKQGRLAEAQTWARVRALAADDEISYLQEYEHITLARLLMAEHENGRSPQSIHTAIELLERLHAAAEQSGRTGSVLEILVTQALAHEAGGSLPAALACLERALVLAEPEGYVRLFVDEGQPMARLLAAAASRGIAPGYTAKLLTAFPQTESTGSKPPSPLVEPLSERELEVLHLVAQGLSNRQIGEQLFLALDTVKGHNRRIYDKLGVQRRTEAVARARELGLIS
ncbi:MAG: LuxR C-terminal-related transcriptional regulator [Chloroflexota bacterium]